MRKGVKIAMAVVATVLVIVGIVVGLLFINREDLPELDVSEVPLYMEWGMSYEEVTKILDNHPEYVLIRGDSKRMPIYQVTNFQGVDGVSGKVAFQFDEMGGLTTVHYSFKSVENGGMCVAEQLALVQKSIEKQLDTHYEKGKDVYELVDVESGIEHWIGQKSLITTQSYAGIELTLNYDSIEPDDEFVDMLRNPEPYLSNQ